MPIWSGANIDGAIFSKAIFEETKIDMEKIDASNLVVIKKRSVGSETSL